MPPKKTEKPKISEADSADDLPAAADVDTDEPLETEALVTPGPKRTVTTIQVVENEPKAMPETEFEGHKLPGPRMPALGRMVHYQTGGKRYLAFVAEEPIELGNPYSPLNLAIYEFRKAFWRSEVNVPYGEATDDGQGGLSYPARCWMNPEYVEPMPIIMPTGIISHEEALNLLNDTEDRKSES